MDTREELLGQARKDGNLPDCEIGEYCEIDPGETRRSDAPAIPYGNPPEAGKQEPPDSPPVSSFA